MKKQSIKSVENYLSKKEKSGKKLLFFEEIGNRNTSRDQMRENLINALIKNGWKITNKDKTSTLRSCHCCSFSISRVSTTLLNSL